MSEPRGQLRKEHLTFPGCSHFRRLDDNHEKCQSCMYGGAPGCTRVSRCHFCADWTSSMWDAEERNRQAAVKRRIRKKDKKASASSTGEPTRPGYESSSEVFPSRNPSPAHSRTSGYSGKAPSPKVHSRDETRVERGRSPSRGRHGVDEDRIELVRSPSKAPRHEVRVERARSPSPVCHERMEPSRSPSVPRGQERSPGVDTLLSDDDFIGYDEFPKGFSGSSPEHSCDDDELLASPPRPPLTPLPVDSPKDNPGRVGIVCHREEAGPARALPGLSGCCYGPWWWGQSWVAMYPGWGVAPRWSGRSSAGEPGSCPGYESCVMESQYVCGPGWNVLPGGGYEPTDPVGVGSPGSYHERTCCCGQCARTAGIRS